MVCYRVKIRFPALLDIIIVAPLLLLRRIWYGYSFRRIPLANCKKYAIVDPADYHVLSQYVWWALKNHGVYHILRFSQDGNCFRYVSMHRQILNFPKNKNVDHINRNGRDNRRANLRLATVAQNNMNKSSRKGTSKYKGVYFQRDVKRWRVTISFNGKKSHLGLFENEIDAAKAYDKAAKKYYGRFAYLNFPPQQKLKGLKPRIRLLFTTPRQVARILTDLFTSAKGTTR